MWVGAQPDAYNVDLYVDSTNRASHESHEEQREDGGGMYVRL